MLRALSHPAIWFRCYRRALVRPVKWLALLAAAAALVFFILFTYIHNKIASTVEPILSRLAELSPASSSTSSDGRFGARWSGTYRFPEERMNREGHQIIKDALVAGGWTLQEEAAAILPDNLMGGFMIRAEKWEHTFVAHLPKSGAELRVDVAKTGRPEVSKPPEEMEITGR